jgi:4-cresol dehydrogenase (hydroxylating)
MAGRRDAGWLAECRRAIGPTHVDVSSATRRFLADAGFASCHRVTARLRPGSAAEVQACLAIAARHGQALYPVSRGQNWGFGSAAPARSGCAILDLSRMNAITNFDEGAGVIAVEPGTTFAAVHELLSVRGSKYFLPAIGGPPTASVIGNAVERGHGIGPNPHRADSLGGMQVVLADGTLVDTGYPSSGQGIGLSSAPHCAGPAWGGLFVQSNLGIVLRASFRLERRPAWLCCFQARVLPARLGALLELLVDARRRGIANRAAITVWNAYKVLATRGGYPWDSMRGRTPLNLDAIGAADEWLVSGAIYAPSRAHAELDRGALEESIRPATVDFAVAFSSPEQPAEGADRFLGAPGEKNLQCLRWRKPAARSGTVDLTAERIGVIWLCPLVAAGPLGADVLARLEQIILRHGFEPQVGMVVDERPLVEVFAAIVYDRALAGEDGRAMRCHDAAVAMLVELGVPLYRLGLPAMRLAAPVGGSAALTQLLKHALDPFNTIAPGRYERENEKYY